MILLVICSKTQTKSLKYRLGAAVSEARKCPWGAGGLHDTDTNLVHREYDPHTGKWTAKDPISNLYGYVLGDSVNFVDSIGKSLLDILGLGLAEYSLWCLADKHLGDDAPENPNMQNVLNNASYLESSVSPVGITTPGLGNGTKVGQTVGDVADITLEVLK
jgi:uncharacterized protein RhaS with RHS repeats